MRPHMQAYLIQHTYSLFGSHCFATAQPWMLVTHLSRFGAAAVIAGPVRMEALVITLGLA